MSLPSHPQLETKTVYACFDLIGSNADVAKLVDALDLGSSAARHGGSSPSIRTTKALNHSTVQKAGKRLGVFNSSSV